ncbi:leukocyte immunoglobulin-like receptor subfamily B member 3 isoform X2 [Notolabrus celidotus]|uniref:leukocyte immunoglobulin-like receptor subfamily B member 3 isoform X2 n=1 Tax=Notolabrus celidotus TaxID=1203425 RepID=UPI00148FC1A5|nr:leukocyte immunoglobulin-like receptor subfamily B member 3 isoform X2 [Notolabrus celidotus]
MDAHRLDAVAVREGRSDTGSLSAPPSTPTLPAPELDIYRRSEDSVVLVCRAPEGHSGVMFMLYRYREKVDSLAVQSGAEEVQFTVRIEEGDSGQQELFCCLYKDQSSRYSAFSPYLQLEHQIDADPTRPVPSFPPPVLSVTPSSSVVKCGDMLTFSCSVPTPLQSLSSDNNKPVTFFLLRTMEKTGATSFILQPKASRVANHEPQPGLFSVGPVRVEEGGEYTCLYQVNKKNGVVNSTVSNMVHITVTDALPVPTLVFQQQTDVWHLLCRGSPAYPGAVFSLYLADHELPVATQHATLIHHQVTFPLPVQDTQLALYQCEYSVLLGGTWSKSERSPPLAVTKGIPPLSSPDAPSVDWPLVLGSFSAVVLFICSLTFVVVVAHRKVKAAAEEKKKRQDAQFWTQVHAKDHIIDLTLRRTSFTPQERATTDATTGTDSRSPLWTSLSTFTTPIHQIH